MKPVLIIDYSVDGLSGAAIAERLGTASSPLRIEPGSRFPSVSPGGFSGIVHSGSALSITRPETFTEGACDLIRRGADLGLPQMGICYGHQLLCLALLGRDSVQRAREGPEIGWLPVDFTHTGIPGIRPRETVWQSHFDRVNRIPPSAVVVAGSPHTPIQAFLDRERGLLGTQFHPEFSVLTGNTQFRRDEALLRENGLDPEEIIARAPDRDAGAVVFSYFLMMIRGEVP